MPVIEEYERLQMAPRVTVPGAQVGHARVGFLGPSHVPVKTISGWPLSHGRLFLHAGSTQQAKAQAAQSRPHRTSQNDSPRKSTAGSRQHAKCMQRT